MEAIQDWETALPLCDPAADTVLIANVCQELHVCLDRSRMLGVAVARRGLDVLGPEHVSHRCRLTGCPDGTTPRLRLQSADPILREALVAEQLGDVELVGEALLLNSGIYLCSGAANRPTPVGARRSCCAPRTMPESSAKRW
jgi:hypothetical protein